MNAPDDLLTADDLTGYGLTPVQARKVFDRRRLPVVKVGRRVYIRRADVEAYVTTRARAAQRAKAWAGALSEARAGLLSAGYAVDVVARVTKHAARFGRESAIDPWAATRDDLTAWAERLPVTQHSRYEHRTSLRTFYRWAYRTGRVPADPADDLPGRLARRGVPVTWSDAVASFLRYVRSSGATPQTVELRRVHLARLAAELPESSPWAVDVEDLVRWFDRHRWSNETIRSHRSTVRTFYAWGVTVGHTDRNPGLALPKVHARMKMPRPAAEDSVRFALLGADPRLRLMVELAASLGLRRGEVARVHTRDVAMGTDGRWWLTVCGKGDKERLLPLSDAQATAIRSARGYVFPGQMDGHLSPARVGELVSEALPPGVTMHQLRHRFATSVYAAGHDLFATQMLLGHASPVTTQRYVQVPPASLRTLVDRVPAVPGTIAT